MINMATMARQECAATKEERVFADWLRQLQNILGSEVDENGLAWDLFADGATPDEAADEMRAC